MTWYDRYKKEQILVQQGAGHNKFWAAYVDESTLTVHIRWGRIGTKGQSQEKKFTRLSDAVNLLSTKFNEKQRKGYVDKISGVPIDGPKLEQLAVEAAIVGTQNKCHTMQWVEIKPYNEQFQFSFIADDRLYDPDCIPGLLVAMETKKEYHGQTRFSILFTGDASYLADQIGRGNQMQPIWLTKSKIEKSDSLYELTQKVEEAVGRSLS